MEAQNERLAENRYCSQRTENRDVDDVREFGFFLSVMGNHWKVLNLKAS